MHNNKGVIYVATGEKFVAMAVMAAKSLKIYCPDLPVHIFTDQNVEGHLCFDSSTKISDPHHRSKVDYMYKTPYKNTLYLDADTRVCEDLSPMFDLLDRFEIAMAFAPGREKQVNKYIGQAPTIFWPMNSGVILYKNTIPVLEFLQTWEKAYHEGNRKRDQFTLRELLWTTKIKMWVLPPEYNCTPKGHIKVLKQAGITPKILHLNDFKREVGIKPKFYSLPIGKKIKLLIKQKIKKPFRRLLLGLPY